MGNQTFLSLLASTGRRWKLVLAIVGGAVVVWQAARIPLATHRRIAQQSQTPTAAPDAGVDFVSPTDPLVLKAVKSPKAPSLVSGESVAINVKPEPMALTSAYIGFGEMAFSVVAQSSLPAEPVMLTPTVAQLSQGEVNSGQENPQQPGQISAVPEPTVMGMIVVGVVGLLASRRRRVA